MFLSTRPCKIYSVFICCILQGEPTLQYGFRFKADDDEHALSSVATGKRAIFWRDLVAFNSTAPADVIRRGFTHTVVKLANQSQWLCQFQQGALRPLLDIGPHNKHLSQIAYFILAICDAYARECMT